MTLHLSSKKIKKIRIGHNNNPNFLKIMSTITSK